MSISTFDAAIWRQYAPTGADYGDHVQTSSGSVLLDGCCFVSAAVRDVDHSQKDPVIMERIDGDTGGKNTVGQRKSQRLFLVHLPCIHKVFRCDFY